MILKIGEFLFYNDLLKLAARFLSFDSDVQDEKKS